MMLAVFRRSCPNCLGKIDDERLEARWVCKSCAEEVLSLPFPENIFQLHELLDGKEKEIKKVYEILKEVEEFRQFFKKNRGSEPWAAQLAWAKRVISGESFSISAPTGMGKTAFGIEMAKFLASKGKRCYLLFPTTALVLQAKEKIPEALAYTGKNKKEFEKRMADNDFSILITTNQFLAKRFEELKKYRFDFIFADDVDSLVKASRNIERVLVLLGFTEEEIERAKKTGESIEKEHGVLIVSTATGKARAKANIFRILLNFGIGGKGEGIRNVYDFVSKGDWKKLVKKLGKGGLIFVPVDAGIEEAEKIAEELGEDGIKAEAVTAGKADLLEEFKKGKIDVLVGVATHYGLLVRGIDLPQIVKYAIFLGVPRFKFKIDEITSLQRLTFLLRILAEIDEEAEEKMKAFQKWIRRLKPEKIQFINRKMEESEIGGFLLDLVNFVRRKVEEKKEKLKEYEFADFEFENGITVYLPDVATYIQASGRTSRLFAGGVTTGVSIVFPDREKLLKGLERAMRRRFEGFRFRDIEELEEVWKKVVEDREKVNKVRGGKVKDPVEPILFIVESPNKARTISRFFGIPSRRIRKNAIIYEVFTGRYMLSIVATLGHVFDIIEDEEFYGVNRELVPIYDSIKIAGSKQFVSEHLGEFERDKLEIIKDLQAIAEEYKRVIIATDPDEEGEKIGWDVALHLLPFCRSINRAEFHEVTPRAIINAIENPREMDENWVKAQIVRRIEDRWIGFLLSRKVQEKFKRSGLSAGRVQTPVLGWIIDAYKKRKQDLHYFFAVYTPAGIFEFEHPTKSKREAKRIAKEIKEVKIEIIEDEERVLNPPPPFDTQSMILEASKLGFGAKKTMQLAQDLFEAGLITYHRTDSTRVSDFGMQIARDYLGELFKARRWGEGGAHECIRPTRGIEPKEIEGLTWDHVRLYTLIFNRFMASQAKEARVTVRRFRWKAGDYGGDEEAVVEIKEEGWLKFSKIKIRKIEEGNLPVQRVRFWLDSKQKLFTQGTLIAEMRKRGIGRPSTYATIVQKLLDRRYVYETKNRYLVPTKLGISVFNFLNEKYSNLVSERRTKEMHDRQDMIRDGKMDYKEVLSDLLSELREYFPGEVKSYFG